MSNIDRLIGQVMASGALSKAEHTKRREEAKEARRSDRLAQKRQQEHLARIENWTDREDKRRPTPQRIIKGVFSLRDGDDAGVTIAVDGASCVIDALATKGRITARQREAGHIFEDVVRGAVGSPAGRSCVDFSPVGYEGDHDDEDTIRAQKRWNSLRRMMRPQDRQECMAVCWQQQAPRNLNRLTSALNVVADWAGLEKPIA